VRHGSWAILILACTAQFMVILDASIVNVALPSIRQDLRLDSANLQWVVNAYVLVFGGFLLLGGRLSDIFGQRRVFLAGLAVFTTASLVGGLAQSGWMLIGARAVQGLGAAILAPTTLGIITRRYADPATRALALSAWAISTTTAGAIGVVLGGVLTSALGWRSVLFVNVPIGVALIVASFSRLTGPDELHRGRRLDVPGSVTVTASLALLIYAVVSTDQYAWTSAHTVTLLVAAAVLFGAFCLVEARAHEPLVPLGTVRIRSVRSANLVALLLGGSYTAVLYFESLYLQQVNGYSPLAAGLAMVPGTAALAVASVLTKQLIPVVPVKVLVTCGPLMAACGAFWLAQRGLGGDYLTTFMLPSVVCLFGMGVCFLPNTTLAVQDAGPADAGLASGLINASRQVGGAVILASLATAAASRSAEMARAHGPVTGAVRQALADGYNLAFALTGGIILLTVLSAALLVPRGRPRAPSPLLRG
jgi:EmrB/QacA subfamily drug resistance transporter